MLLEDLHQLKRGPRECRHFAWILASLLLLSGGWLAWKGWPGAPWCIAAGLVILALGLLAPTTLRPAFLAWMAVGLALGAVVSILLLTLFFYCILTPIGLLARIVGKDFLELRKPANTATYWHPRGDVPERERYERQF